LKHDNKACGLFYKMHGRNRPMSPGSGKFQRPTSANNNNHQHSAVASQSSSASNSPHSVSRRPSVVSQVSAASAALPAKGNTNENGGNISVTMDNAAAAVQMQPPRETNVTRRMSSVSVASNVSNGSKSGLKKTLDDLYPVEVFFPCPLFQQGNSWFTYSTHHTTAHLPDFGGTSGRGAHAACCR
jgi:hypothetical protein